MSLNRRQFLAGTVVAITAGCQREDTRAPADASPSPTEAAPGTPATQAAEQTADAGAVAEYGTDQVYDQFRQDGFFVVRREGKLFALSSVCTHKGCKVRAQSDGSFVCKCHGSRFSPDGKVLNGPAVRDLPRLPVAATAEGHLLVKLG